MHSPSLESSLVRLLIDDQEPRRPEGAGFLVTPKHILTCAHVVNAVLRRNEQDQTANRPVTEVFLDFPLLNNRSLLRAKIIHWFPVADDAATGTTSTIGTLEDIAVLELPYRGLEAFREKDAALYFGRDKTIARLRQVVADQPFAAVIGASGSGKSSVVFAGLIPALRQSGDWLIAYCRPKKQPLYELSACLIPLLYDDPILRSEKSDELKEKLHAGSVGLTGIIRQIRKKNEGQYFLLIIDQFEELFTLNADKELIRLYIDLLLECLNTEDFTVLFTMRADFLAAAVSSPALAEALDSFAPIILPQIDEQGLRGVIEQPAKLLGVSFEAGLVDLIIRDVGKEPGSLPLLEFCLTQLWERQEFRQITHAAYTAIGGVQQALAHHADAVYAEFTESEREQLRHIFLKLVRPGQGTEDTRQVATVGQIQEKYRGLITRLADKRLIVTGRDEERGEETVEVVHEALIRRWQTLRQWVDEERGGLVLQEQVRVINEFLSGLFPKNRR